MRHRTLAVLAIACLFAGLGCGGGTTNSGGGGGNGGGGGGGGGGGTGGGGNAACSQIATGQGASLNGFIPFPSNSLWNQDISGAAVDSNSAAIISFIGGSTSVHPDFGAGLYNGSSMGIPYVAVDSTQAPVTVNFTAYGDESDPGPMPIPANAPIEGDPNPSGDQHVLVVDKNQCWLYELYLAAPASGGTWNAGSAAVWDMLANGQRPYTWTSADAAGLPIFPVCCATTKLQPARSNMPSVSRCNTAGRRSCCRRHTGRPTPAIRMRRRWACACA